ncbi:MAG: gamma-glutamyltransferase [Rhodospirillaceae bacterium]
MLEEGGNAFDAALAGFLAACVAEPVLASLGGGGFMLARPARERAAVYDFFVQTPRRFRAAEDCDFAAVTADFGSATQQFHCGWASAAVPGAVRGVFAVHSDLGHIPLAEVAAPALEMARRGTAVNAFQAYALTVVEPILRHTPACAVLFTGQDGSLLREGDSFAFPDFADMLDALVHEGPDLFYRGEIARAVADACAEHGGHLGMDDFAAYAIHMRPPLEVRMGNAVLHTNPPPSTGGILIAFALELLKEQGLDRMAWGGAEHRRLLATVMEATNAARLEAETLDAETLLAPELVEAYRARITGQPKAFRGTTHISVIDATGNACALSVSNGEGNGCVIPGTGIVLNNMLGEEDLNPQGWHAWPGSTRLSSMMAPSLLLHDDGTETALGSGGSNRIRTALVQVLSNLTDFGLPLEKAVARPRIHAEAGRLSAEVDLPDVLRPEWPEIDVWPDINLFFGGVHVARRTHNGGLEGFGDPRRGGVAEVV